MTATFSAWLAAHPLVPVLFWLVITGTFNALLALRGIAGWVTYLEEKSPGARFAFRALRSVGFDPVKLVVAFQAFLAGRARGALDSISEITRK